MAGPNPSLRCVEDGSGAWRRAIGVFLTGTSLSTVNGILCYIGISCFLCCVRDLQYIHANVFDAPVIDVIFPALDI